jgi:hypothetical protein
MQTREYRLSASILLCVGAAVLCLALGLFLVIDFFFPPHAGARPARLVFGFLSLLFAAAVGAQGIFGRKLVVTDDGLRGFQDWHRLVIPWSSVRAFTVKYASKSRTYMAYVTLDNGKQVPLGDPSYKRERVERFAAELTEALREHREQAG